MLNMLSKTRKWGAKSCSTSMAPNVQLTKEGELFEDPERYKSLVGKLNYLTKNSPKYCLFNKCFESVYVISHIQSLGS